MILGLTYVDSKTEVGLLVLDVLMSEEIELGGQVTRYAVEDGTEINDHIIVESEKLSISGMLSNMELYDSFGSGLGRTRLMSAVDTLRSMRGARSLISVTTGLGIYKDMGIENIRVKRAGAGKGNWLDISINLVKVTKATLRQADLPPERAAPRARGRAGQTQQRATSAGGGEQFGPFQQQSMASRLQQNGIVNRLGGAFGLPTGGTTP